jgi:5-formyltetrahydrofolate cyclo-ligase
VDDPDLASAKAELREELLAARRALTEQDVAAARAAVRAHVLDQVSAGCVAAYEPLRTEPGSVELLAALAEGGTRVIVPITRPDRDLDWAEWTPAGRGEPLGVGAVCSADVVLVPALAVGTRDGARLGRGGGSYDRALSRVGAVVPTAALLYDGEILAEVPSGPLDVAVRAAVTPSGWLRLAGNAGFPSGR